MPITIYMYWDGFDDPFEDGSLHGIAVADDWPDEVQIPDNACGFRLQRPGEWKYPWHFSYPGLPGAILKVNDFEYSSEYVATLGAGYPDFIEARGPVYACQEGSFSFYPTLTAFGVPDPVIAGAGSFTAQFSDPKEVTFLNSAGQEIEPPEPEWEEEPKLPKEFLDEYWSEECVPHELGGAIYDAICTEQPGPPTSFASTEVVSSPGFLPYVTPALRARRPVRTRRRVSGRTVAEVECPTTIWLTARFVKNPRFSSAEVAYRFVTNYGNSPAFHTFVDGRRAVTHAATFPFKRIVTPGHQGPPRRPDTITVEPDRPDPSPEGHRPIRPTDPEIAFLPEDEHLVVVKLEVLNGEEEMISPSTTLRFRCKKPAVTPAVHGPSTIEQRH
jgi:hypothetical protein